MHLALPLAFNLTWRPPGLKSPHLEGKFPTWRVYPPLDNSRPLEPYTDYLSPKLTNFTVNKNVGRQTFKHFYFYIYMFRV